MRARSSSSCIVVRALSAGIAPMIPARHCATSSAGVEAMNIGPAMTGSASRALQPRGELRIAAHAISRNVDEALIERLALADETPGTRRRRAARQMRKRKRLTGKHDAGEATVERASPPPANGESARATATPAMA